ncbi:glycoside hydrolase family 23 [Lacrimispora brassicae]
MNKNQTRKPLFPEISQQYQFHLKKYKKKKFYFKARLILTVILPIIILVLSIKVAETFIRIKVRNLFAKPVHDSTTEKSGVAVPVQAEPVDKEIIHPQRVSGDS